MIIKIDNKLGIEDMSNLDKKEMLMIKLTAPNGTDVEVNKNSIITYYPNDGSYDKRAKTVLVLPGEHQAVKETIEQVRALING